MNYLQKNFIYLSQIIRIPVLDAATGRKVGITSDIVATLREMYPKVSGLVVERPFHLKKAFIPWASVRKVNEEKAILVENAADVLAQDSPVPVGEILLCKTFWDKQIVDISGSKVVRVNDLHLLREDPNFWVVHMDIGSKGLIRRLGWTRPVEFLVRWLFSYELKDKLISWKVVQPITSAKGSELLSLRTPGTRLSELHPADLADILIDLGTDERVAMLNALDRDMAAKTMQELPMNIRVQTAALLNSEQFAHIIREMPTDEAADLLAHFPRKKLAPLFALLPKEKAEQINTLLQLSEHIAGSIMMAEYAAAKHSQSAGSVLEKLRTESKNKEIYYIFVFDDNDLLAGMVTLRQLLAAPPERPVSEFMRKRIVRVRVDTDVKEVAQIFYKYDFTVVPVVDRHNKMQGIITIKDAFEAVFHEIREESEEAT